MRPTTAPTAVQEWMVNNMRLIDADAFDKRLVRLGALSIKSALDEEPTIDAVPVVRCKDCKHYGTNTASKLKTCYVHILTPHPMPEDAFCSYGEPRGERKE